MRGKTNIPPRKSLVINGDVKDFVVESGNTIAQGDFVSYALNSEYATFDSRSMTLVYKYEYDETNHKSVLTYKLTNTSCVAMLVQVKNGDLVVLDSISIQINQSFGGAYSDGTNYFICDAPTKISSTYTYPVTKKYTITGDKFTFVQNYTHKLAVVNSSDGNICGIAVKGSTLYIGVRSVGTLVHFYIYQADLNTETVTAANRIDVFPNTDDYSTGLTASLTAYPQGNYLVFVCTFGMTNVKGLIATLSTTSFVNTVTFSKTLYRVDKFGSRYCVFDSGKYLSFVEFNDGQLSLVHTQIISDIDTSLMYYAMGRVTANKYVFMAAISGTSKMLTRTFTFSGSVTYVDNDSNKRITMDKDSLQCILSDYTTNVLLANMTTSKQSRKYYGIVASNGFVLGQPTNYVRSYDGGHTVGFARTSGSAGETIQVSVPYNS